MLYLCSVKQLKTKEDNIMTTTQNKAYQSLENLVTSRFNKKTLEKKLSQIFGENVTLIKVDDKELVGDYEFTFGVNNDKSELYGYGTIYYLPMRRGNESGHTIYVTEVFYEFERVK